jgi:hypothetical protein
VLPEKGSMAVASSGFEKAGFFIQLERILAKEKLIISTICQFVLPDLHLDCSVQQTAGLLPASGVRDE